MFPKSTAVAGIAALLTIVWGALILSSQRDYPFRHTFPHDIGAPVLALELSRGSGDIEAVLDRGDPVAGPKAIAIQRRANQLDLFFIPIYTFFLWALARLFTRRMLVLTILIAAVGVFDYWEDWRIFEALDGKNPAVWVPSLWKWGLLAVVLAITGMVMARAGGAVYSVATNRLLALAYLISAVSMGIAVAAGQRFGYSLITLANEIFSVIILIHAIGLLGRHLHIPALMPEYTEDFCEKRGKTKDAMVAVKPVNS